ncbi:MAG: hypothetical protein ACOCUR_00865 [Nanoarchaeota archaeon]
MMIFKNKRNPECVDEIDRRLKEYNLIDDSKIKARKEKHKVVKK